MDAQIACQWAGQRVPLTSGPKSVRGNQSWIGTVPSQPTHTSQSA
jgi:hypothetical protein